MLNPAPFNLPDTIPTRISSPRLELPQTLGSSDHELGPGGVLVEDLELLCFGRDVPLGPCVPLGLGVDL
eukprot:4632221-Prorocentrum_lima.AAC.1